MTREEEINNASCAYWANNYANIEFIDEEEKELHSQDIQDSFINGAEWADAHPHWISVEDELPPRFVLDPNESMNVITYGLHTMVNWYDYERGEWVRDSEITHWMPLPAPPESGSSEIPNNSKATK